MTNLYIRNTDEYMDERNRHILVYEDIKKRYETNFIVKNYQVNNQHVTYIVSKHVATIIKYEEGSQTMSINTVNTIDINNIQLLKEEI